MRTLKALLGLLVLFGVLFVGADRLAVNLAEDKVAEKVRSSRGLNERPAVEIHGFPFLTQVVGKELESVDATMNGLTVQVGGRDVDVTEVDVRLSDVRLEDNFSSAVADRAAGSARISYQDLTEAGTKGASLAYAGAERAARNQVRLDVNLTLVELTLHSSVEVEDGDTVALHAEDLPDLPVAEDVVRAQIDRKLKITGLPAGLKLEKAEVDEKGVVLHLSGSNVNLAG
ncbi:LmeA family phospholipid-binding protein [Streptomyces radiopugnans]|uniref:LmeA family phospholipid-binding protein n=1 Tax=Streptomyces radiopugnans TaxID=403935 RepID=UPI003F1B0230